MNYPYALLKKRHAANKRFICFGKLSILIGLGFLFLLIGSIFKQGYTAFYQTKIALETNILSTVFNQKTLKQYFPSITSKEEVEAFLQMFSSKEISKIKQNNGVLSNTPSNQHYVLVSASDEIDMLNKGILKVSKDGAAGNLTYKQIQWFSDLKHQGKTLTQFNWGFLTNGDSREPEHAGIWGALMGSLLTLIITFAAALPLGIGAAIYLEEISPKNHWATWIEININNLAAVPSIIFGILGLAIFIVFFGLPRSTPLVGGLTLALMILPIIIVSSRTALRSVPNTIRIAALGLGATPLQVVFHHTLPLAFPGILTGFILSLARVFGETAPLLMIGMVAFIAETPENFTDPATVLPVQIFSWSRSAEIGFIEKTSGAIIVLLAVLAILNAGAVILRKHFEHKWQ